MEHLVTTLSQSKALAAAGVKGESVYWWYGGSRGVSGGWILASEPPFFFEESLRAYTLSELISMCGEEKTLTLRRIAGRWYAAHGDGLQDFFLGDGSTPIEAVTKLLLSINK